MRYLDEAHREMNDSDLGFLPAARHADTTDWHTRNLAPIKPAVLGRWTRSVVIATAVWSVLELPFELWVSMSTRDALACVVAKVLWVALVGFVLAGSRVARIAYAFLCTIGLMAVAFGLPVEYRVFPLGFVLSSVECVLKATAFVCLVSAGVYPDEE
ncbi:MULTISPECIES: hypothetical protein [Paraburkholderia]|uniref:Uncharacterized protein n=1 Tax=Paraburkholderia dioscoreae TaxID=2604047 RepID=A0A5Q4Z318_9BURK|nr:MULTISPECIES: hypothetical protein [Paraburkholderia]MDR8399953.1 hypothetical protein [Paraburkholderia sp. USG1]VVD32004.1 conserved membrane protein of unknown function [Paraburkholderia dioscoreae]